MGISGRQALLFACTSPRVMIAGTLIVRGLLIIEATLGPRVSLEMLRARGKTAVIFLVFSHHAGWLETLNSLRSWCRSGTTPVRPSEGA